MTMHHGVGGRIIDRDMRVWGLCPVGDPGSRVEVQGVEDLYRILVADRRASLRQGLAMRLALEPDLQLVGAVGDATALLTALADTGADAIVLDVEILEASRAGPSVLETLRSTAPNVAIVLLALHAPPQKRTGWLANGADALLLKQDTGAALPRAIRQAVRARTQGDFGGELGPSGPSEAPRL